MNNQNDTAPDYDSVGRTRAIESIVVQIGWNEFDLDEQRVREALHVLDLLTAAAMDAAQPDYIQQHPKPPYDLAKLAQRNWSVANKENLRIAHDLLKEIADEVGRAKTEADARANERRFMEKVRAEGVSR